MDLKMNSYDKCERMCHSVDVFYENTNEYYSSHIYSTDLQKGKFRNSEEWTSLCSNQPGANESSPPNMCCVSSSPLFQQYTSVFYSPIDKEDQFFDEGFYAASSTNIISPPTVVRIVKRRNTANKKERRRTQSINTAFSSLRNKIPNVPADTKLSKIKTLRLATSYISYLSRVLEGDQDPAGGFRAELISSSRKLNADRRTTTKHEIQGLLKFAMEATRSEDAPNLPRMEQMDEERKKFLEEVLNSMTVDTVEEFQKALETLQSDTSSDEDKIASMELLQEFVDNIDHANNFVKLGGAKVLISCLESNNANIKKLATSLIAGLCQNNPFCQSEFGTEKVFRLLMNILSDDIASSGAMHAISCLVRHHEASLSSFVEIGGLECLSAAISSNRENIVIKTCFLISSLASEFPHIRDKLIETGNIEILTSNLKAELDNPVKNESILRALLSLTQCPTGKSYLRKTNIEPILKQLIQASTDKPELQEIEEYSTELLNFFQISPTDDAER